MSSRRCAGLSLIELLVFIVVFGIGIVGLVVLYNQLTHASVDPLVRKQTLAIASSLLEEIELRPFTYCDPQSANVYTATATAGQCGGAAFEEGMGPETGETRYAEPRFDNVNDYHNFQMGSGTTDPGIKTVDSNGTTSVAGLADYAVRVTVCSATSDPVACPAAQIANDAPSVATTDDVLLITVTAQHVPSGVTVSLQGYRLRYAPNSP